MIITIGRQYGSGGREVGEKLAKKLGYKFYDQELVEMAAEKSNMHSSILHQADEKASKSLLYSIVTGMDSRFLNPYYELPINDKLFIEQSNIIKSLGEEGNCVIVGRCADYVIETAKMKSIDLFIYASMEHKIERISGKYELTPEKAKDKILLTFEKEATEKNISVLNEDGTINRRELAKIVFSSKENLKKQESIIHPIVNEMMEDFIQNNSDKTVILNATVLYKTPIINKCDAIIFITSPWIIRFFRAKKRDKIKNIQIFKTNC